MKTSSFNRDIIIHSMYINGLSFPSVQPIHPFKRLDGWTDELRPLRPLCPISFQYYTYIIWVAHNMGIYISWVRSSFGQRQTSTKAGVYRLNNPPEICTLFVRSLSGSSSTTHESMESHTIDVCLTETEMQYRKIL